MEGDIAYKKRQTPTTKPPTNAKQWRQVATTVSFATKTTVGDTIGDASVSIKERNVHMIREMVASIMVEVCPAVRSERIAAKSLLSWTTAWTGA